MQELTVETATFKQLQSIAKLSGLDFTDLDEGALRQLVRDTMGTHIDPALLSKTKIGSTNRKLKSSNATVQAKPSDKIRLILSEGNGAGGASPVPVGVNGKIMLIPRGEEVEIPRTYFNVLKDAISRVTYQEGETGTIKSRDVASYPFQILSDPVQA